MFDCRTCPDDDGRREAFGCPDRGATLDPPIELRGTDGRVIVALDGCPGYYRRAPGVFGPVPFAVDARDPYHVTLVARRDLDAGALGPSGDLPAKLHDAILIVEALEAERVRARMAEAERRHRSEPWR